MRAVAAACRRGRIAAGAIARLGGSHFYQDYIACAAISPDGQRVATTGNCYQLPTPQEREAYKRRIYLWDVATGAPLRVLEIDEDPIYCLAFSPDGKRLAVGCRYRMEDKWAGIVVIVFDVDSGKPLVRLLDFESDLRRVQFSTDGKQLYVSEREGPVSPWTRPAVNDCTSGNRRSCRP